MINRSLCTPSEPIVSYLNFQELQVWQQGLLCMMNGHGTVRSAVMDRRLTKIGYTGTQHSFRLEQASLDKGKQYISLGMQSSTCMHALV